MRKGAKYPVRSSYQGLRFFGKERIHGRWIRGGLIPTRAFGRTIIVL